MRIFIPAKPHVPDDCLQAISGYTLFATLPLFMWNIGKEFGISERMVFVGYLILVSSPAVIYYGSILFPLFMKFPPISPEIYEWSYYASLMGVLMIQVCLMIGIRYGMLLPILLAITISFILPILAANIREERCQVYYVFLKKQTPTEIAIMAGYSLTAILFIYFFPLGTDSFAKNECCLNKWVCSYHSAYDHKSSLMATTFFSISTAFGCLKLWQSTHMVAANFNEEIGDWESTILERRGWKWVVDGEPERLHLD